MSQQPFPLAADFAAPASEPPPLPPSDEVTIPDGAPTWSQPLFVRVAKFETRLVAMDAKLDKVISKVKWQQVVFTSAKYLGAGFCGALVAKFPELGAKLGPILDALSKFIGS